MGDCFWLVVYVLAVIGCAAIVVYNLLWTAVRYHYYTIQPIALIFIAGFSVFPFFNVIMLIAAGIWIMVSPRYNLYGEPMENGG